jgi:hypothetical protein
MALLTLSPTAGTQPDIVGRLKSVLPNGWFADTTPVLDGILNGLAAGWAGLFTLLSYVQLQTRIATATDVFLDLIAQDFFAGGITRAVGEPDVGLRARIDRALFAPCATRSALINAITNLTNRPPLVFEPARIEDTGAYGVAPTLAYNNSGGWGCRALPFQCFVHVYRPLGAGVAYCAGFGNGAGGYGAGAIQYATPTLAASTIRDTDISSAIAATIPAATTAWIVITD